MTYSSYTCSALSGWTRSLSNLLNSPIMYTSDVLYSDYCITFDPVSIILIFHTSSNWLVPISTVLNALHYLSFILWTLTNPSDHAPNSSIQFSPPPSHVSTNSPGKMYNIYTLLMSLKHLYPLKYARTQLPTKLAVVTFLASEVRPSYEPQNGLSLQ